MADEKKENGGVKAKSPRTFVAETQRERWVKYGANVVLTCLIVFALAGFLVYIAQRHNIRADTTASGAYSLKPPTVQLIKNSPQKVKLVGLFSRKENPQQAQKRVQDTSDSAEVRYQQVADLLSEYESESGGKIDAVMIDPDSEPGKVEQLFQEVQKKYGNDVRRYEEVLQEYPKTLDEINRLAKEEIEGLKKLPPIKEEELARTARLIINTIDAFPQLLDIIRVDVKKQLELKVPDYKGAADAIRGGLEGLNERIDAVLKRFATAKENKSTPKEFQEYMTTAQVRYETMKKTSGDLLKKLEGLGELKQLDELRQNRRNSIAIMGENDLKVIPQSEIFKVEEVRMMDGAGNIRPRFAGEQQISTALVTLTSKEKKKVAFIRTGGPPMTARSFGYEGQLSDVADRLRQLNVEVLDKDVSGTWQMQAMQLQMQGMMFPPDATDEQLKDALWVVLVAPQDPRQMMMNPSAGQIGPKVNDHLKNGGSAMILIDPQAERLEFLKEWGIEARPDLLIVHDKVEAQGARSDDIAMDYWRQQPVFIMNQYGDHPVTRPLRSLDSLMVPLIPVNTVDGAKGVKLTKVLPVPDQPRAWAESDFDTIRQGKPVEYNAPGNDKDNKMSDLPPPLWGGVIAEKEDGKGRLIVIGCRRFAFNEYLNEPDYQVARSQHRFVPRFPGNEELFVNGIFWLLKMDTMIAISPASFEVARVKPQMGDGTKRFWHIVAIGVLPAMVLCAGAMVYAKRRD